MLEHNPNLSNRLAAVLPPGTFFSPTSIELAVALLAAGATGQTLDEIQSVLEWPRGPNWQIELTKRFAPLIEAIHIDEPLLAIACRVYSKAPLYPEYIRAIESAFHSAIEPLESAQQVNNFVSKSTRQKINSIVNDKNVQDSRVIAVNAIYFKGKWATPFRRENTEKATFFTAKGTNTECHMMCTSTGKSWSYYEDANAQYVLLPYGDGTVQAQQPGRSPISALVVLPKSVKENALEQSDWQGAIQKMRNHEGVVWLPRFAVESDVELSAAFKTLGVQRAFMDEMAEFNGVSPENLSIGLILHKVKVEVDEEGTVAAAATAVVSVFGSVGHSRPTPFEMRCDRPFGFCIVSAQLSPPLVLFAGTVINPGAVGPVPSNSANPLTRQQDVPPYDGKIFNNIFAGNTTWPSQPAANAVPSVAFGVPQPQPIQSSPNSTIPTNPPTNATWPPRPAVNASAPTASNLTPGQRREQQCLFTSCCLRDVYTVLCGIPRESFGHMSNTPGNQNRHALQWFFADGRFYRITNEIQDLGEKVDQTLRALGNIGREDIDGASLTFTEAFEKLLVNEYVSWWTDDDAARLSTAFVCAFGWELTPRLDISHRLRSRPVSQQDLDWLRNLPKSLFDCSILDIFQSSARINS